MEDFTYTLNTNYRISHENDYHIKQGCFITIKLNYASKNKLNIRNVCLI